MTNATPVNPYIDTCVMALREYAVARLLGKAPPALPPLRRPVLDEASLQEAIDDTCAMLEAYPGEISASVVYHVVRERVDLWQAAIEHHVALDVLDIAERMARGAKYLVHGKEIAFYILINLPASSGLSPEAQAVQMAIRAKIQEEYGERMEGTRPGVGPRPGFCGRPV